MSFPATRQTLADELLIEAKAEVRSVFGILPGPLIHEAQRHFARLASRHVAQRPGDFFQQQGREFHAGQRRRSGPRGDGIAADAKVQNLARQHGFRATAADFWQRHG